MIAVEATGAGCEAVSRRRIAEAWIVWFQELAACFREASLAAVRLADALSSYAAADAESALKTLSDLEGRLLAHAREGEALRLASRRAFALEDLAPPSTYVKLLSARGEERRLAEILEARMRAAEEAVREFARARARLQGVAEAGIREAELARALLASQAFGAPPPSAVGKLPPRVFDGRA